MEKLCMVYITASNREEAGRIGKEIVSRRLAACANIFDGVTSFYRWGGKEQHDTESVLILKTREALLPELEKAVKDIHSYSCPCIVTIPVLRANDDYAKWVLDETQKDMT
ncbi:MAG: divalent-cation tolerance protein CutA [Candidatus Omnitrophota bacterium]